MPSLSQLLSVLTRPTFRMTLSQYGAAMVAITGIGVVIVAYVNAQATVEDLSLQIFDSQVTYTAARAADYSDSAHHSLSFTRRLVEDEVFPHDAEAISPHLIGIVRSNPRLTTAGFGHPSGEAAWATRELDGRMLLHQYLGHDTGEIVHKAYKVEGDELTLVTEERATYDATTRPWFTGAVAADGPIWTDPYMFIPENIPGISLAQKVERDGELLGALTVDFRLAFLSRALEGMDQGYGTHGVIFDSAGHVLGHTDATKTRSEKDGAIQIAMLDGHADPLVRRLAELPLETLGESSLSFFEHDGERYALAVHRPTIDDHGQLAWWTAVIVPEAALLRDVRTHAIWSLATAALGLLGAIFLSIILSRQLTRSFYGFYEEMERVGQLDLEPRPREGTRIQEVERLGDRLEALKKSLASFSRYVPVDLVRQLLAAGQEARLGGETRELTVMFTDIAGFTTIMESTTAEELLDALGVYLHQQDEAIRSNGGNVSGYLGDGLMALFGAPTPDAEHAVRACKAALAARDAAETLAAKNAEAGLPEFHTRIGVNTGSVLVGNIGAPERFNYTAIGDTVNTASRIEGLNKLYKTGAIIGARTRELVGDAVVVRPLERVRMKGKNKPVLVYELVGLPGEVPDATVTAIERYEAALDAFSARDFQTALEGFKEAGELFGGDQASHLMAVSCRVFLETPPPDDWDGARRMTVK